MSTVYLDLETYCDVPIEVGTYRYAESAQILLAAYAVDDGPVEVWDATNARATPSNHSFFCACEAADELVAHNAQFDRVVLSRTVGHRPHQIGISGKWRCTMVKAFLHGFPGGLDDVGRILGLGTDHGKLSDGKRLINKFCMPQADGSRRTRETDPEDWDRFVDYARRDIIAMREVDRRLPRWNEPDDERALWRLDQRINDRGLCVDTDLVQGAAALANQEAGEIAERFLKLTYGEVDKPTKREQIKRFLLAYFDLELPNTQAATLRRLLDDDNRPLNGHVSEILELIITGNKTSTAKYARLRDALSSDGRFRGGLQFSGAQRTRRYAGRIFQPQNLPSRGLPPQEEIDLFIRGVHAGCADLLFDRITLHASGALRGTIIAPEGRKLAVADLSNIEGRVNAWIAGEEWKLRAFEDNDAGTGPDLYKVAAGRILGKAPDAIDKVERNGIGKVAELALGYQGGVGAIQNMARGKMAKLWHVIADAAPEALERAEQNYEKWGQPKAVRAEIPREEWLVSDAVKVAWRTRHPAIQALWYACEDAARAAVAEPGVVYPAGPLLKFRAQSYKGHFYLVCRLPSGNFLVYFQPRVCDETGKITYWGTNQVTRQWSRLDIYGGKFVENACQSIARDVLMHAMPVAEDWGYEIVLSVHDELIAETSDGDGEDLAGVMAENPPWATGLPLAAGGFTTDRYRKD
ncbi:MAG: DNA polymerase I [Pseudomonadota bacterium]